jgi:hypothetical protein
VGEDRGAECSYEEVICAACEEGRFVERADADIVPLSVERVSFETCTRGASARTYSLHRSGQARPAFRGARRGGHKIGLRVAIRQEGSLQIRSSEGIAVRARKRGRWSGAAGEVVRAQWKWDDGIKASLSGDIVID